MKIRKADALFRQGVYIRGRDVTAITGQIPIPEVVGDDEDEVRSGICRYWSCGNDS